MHLRPCAQVCAPQIPVHRDSAIAFSLGESDILARSKIFEAVGEEIRVGVSEDERAELHDAHKTGEIEDFCVWISAV